LALLADEKQGEAKNDSFHDIDSVRLFGLTHYRPTTDTVCQRLIVGRGSCTISCPSHEAIVAYESWR
jgi:hypothetical protein